MYNNVIPLSKETPFVMVLVSQDSESSITEGYVPIVVDSSFNGLKISTMKYGAIASNILNEISENDDYVLRFSNIIDASNFALSDEGKSLLDNYGLSGSWNYGVMKIDLGFMEPIVVREGQDDTELVSSVLSEIENTLSESEFELFKQMIYDRMAEDTTDSTDVTQP